METQHTLNDAHRLKVKNYIIGNALHIPYYADYSKKARQVLISKFSGYTDEEVAKSLKIDCSTVKYHKTRCFSYFINKLYPNEVKKINKHTILRMMINMFYSSIIRDRESRIK